jgi:hypothetical protein
LQGSSRPRATIGAQALQLGALHMIQPMLVDRCAECRAPADEDSYGPDGEPFCWRCYPYGAPMPADTATEDVLVAPPNARNVTPRELA